MLCPCCFKYELKLFNGKYVKRCRFCTQKLQNEKANEKRLKQKQELDRQRLVIKNCERCGKEYQTLIQNQKFCFDPCTTNKRSIAESNGLWDKPKKPAKKQYYHF